MKITESRFRQIIREEARKSLTEQAMPDAAAQLAAARSAAEAAAAKNHPADAWSTEVRRQADAAAKNPSSQASMTARDKAILIKAQAALRSGEAQAQNAANAKVAAPGPAGKSGIMLPVVHTVVNGDTLGTIAQYYYGNPKQWQTIYAANKQSIANPNLILAGSTVVIPKLPGMKPAAATAAPVAAPAGPPALGYGM